MILSFELLLSNLPTDRLFGLDLANFLSAGANLINVALLAAVLSFLLYRPVRKMLQKRTDKIRDQLTQAETDMTKALEMRTQYDQKIEEINRERDEILTEARKLAVETSQRIISEAKAEAETLKDRAAANVQMEWERAEVKMRDAIIEVSAVMAEKLVTISMNKDTQDRLYEEAIADMGGVRWRD